MIFHFAVPWEYAFIAGSAMKSFLDHRGIDFPSDTALSSDHKLH